MNKKAILGLALGASGHHAAKPSGLGRRVDGIPPWWDAMVPSLRQDRARREPEQLVFLSGETSLSCVWPCVSRSRIGNDAGGLGGVSREHSSSMYRGFSRQRSEQQRAGSSCRRIIRPAKVSGWLTSREGLNRSELATRPGPKGTGTTTIPSPLARLAGIRRPAKRMTARRGLLGCGGAACARRVRLSIIQLRSGNVSEPLSADPHAEWCGGLGS